MEGLWPGVWGGGFRVEGLWPGIWGSLFLDYALLFTVWPGLKIVWDIGGQGDAMDFSGRDETTSVMLEVDSDLFRYAKVSS